MTLFTPPHPLVGPQSRKHCWGRDGHIKRWSRIPRPQRGGSGCKTKHCWGLDGVGSVPPSKSGPVVYILLREARRPNLVGAFALPAVCDGQIGTAGTWAGTARSSWKIRQNGGSAAFLDWNTHFIVFSGGVERGLGGLMARSSWKIHQNGGWEARRLDLAGLFTPPPPAAHAVYDYCLLPVNKIFQCHLTLWKDRDRIA